MFLQEGQIFLKMGQFIFAYSMQEHQFPFLFPLYSLLSILLPSFLIKNLYSFQVSASPKKLCCFAQNGFQLFCSREFVFPTLQILQSIANHFLAKSTQIQSYFNSLAVYYFCLYLLICYYFQYIFTLKIDSTHYYLLNKFLIVF